MERYGQAARTSRRLARGHLVLLSVQPIGALRPLIGLEKLPHPGGHGLRVVQGRQENHIAGAVPLEEALVQHLPGGKRAAAGIPRETKEPHALGS